MKCLNGNRWNWKRCVAAWPKHKVGLRSLGIMLLIQYVKAMLSVKPLVGKWISIRFHFKPDSIYSELIKVASNICVLNIEGKDRRVGSPANPLGRFRIYEF